MEYNLTSCSPNDYFLYLRKSRADNEYETVEETLAKHERQLQDFAIRLLGNRIPEHNIFARSFPGRQSRIVLIYRKYYLLSNHLLYAAYLSLIRNVLVVEIGRMVVKFYLVLDTAEH